MAGSEGERDKDGVEGWSPIRPGVLGTGFGFNDSFVSKGPDVTRNSYGLSRRTDDYKKNHSHYVGMTFLNLLNLLSLPPFLGIRVGFTLFHLLNYKLEHDKI